MARWRWILLIAGIVVVAALPKLGLPRYYVSLLTQAFILGLAASSLDLLVGQTGIVSLAHASFFGIGGYAVAILAVRLGIESFPVAFLVGTGLAALAAAIFGLVALRGEGVSLMIITLALNQIVWGWALQWASFTGGENGIGGFSRPRIGSLELFDRVHFYWFSLAFLVVGLVVLWLISRSSFGLALLGIREQPRRMRVLGYNTWLYRYAAFITAGLFAGMAGVMHAYFNMYVSPADLSLAMATQMLMMVILGGVGSLVGPVFGAAVIIFLGNYFSGILDRWQLVLGAAYILIVMYAPGGLMGLFRRRLPWPLRRARSGEKHLAGSGGVAQ